MHTRHGVLGGATWTRGKASKALMRLVTSRCRQIRAPSSSMQRGKMALVLLSAQLTTQRRSTAQERKIYGVFQLVSHKVQYANPGQGGTACRVTPHEADPRLTKTAPPLPLGAGLFRPPMGTRDWSIVRVCSRSPPMGC